jgi:spermidine synthase
MRRALLLFVAFLAGAILMGLELIGSRLLAPTFGGSIFVWGSLIGVFLAAMSLGYYVAGKLVDRWPSSGLLALLLLAAGIYVLLLPRYGADVCWWIADREEDVRAGSLTACLILFFVPGMLMAVTSPFVIRLTARDVEHVGETAGVVYAVSTIGSIVGTLGTAFFLVGLMGTTKNLLLLGGLLIATAALAALVRQPTRAPGAAAALLALCVFARPADAAADRILLERDSPYHKLIVSEDGEYRWLRADNIWHTEMNLKDKHGRGLPYTNYIDLAFLFNPDIKSVLILGLGGGTIPKRLLRDYPDVVVEAVEIDPDVIKIAARHFECKPGPRLRIHEADGRLFLRRSRQKWDLIMMDAYYADTVPFFLTTEEFFKTVQSRLSPGGVFVNNVVSQVSGPRSKFFRSVYKTMGAVFSQVHVFPVPESGGQYINIEVFAPNTTRRITQAELRGKAALLQGKVIKDDELLRRVGQYLTAPVQTKDVQILTDDFAPVDHLLNIW